MLLRNELMAAMVRAGKTRQDVANCLGITRQTLTNKLKAGVFGSDEIEKMIDYLDIDDPMKVFFAR